MKKIGVLPILLLLPLFFGRPVMAAEEDRDLGGEVSEEKSGEEETAPYAGRLKEAQRSIRQKKVGKYGMVPIYPRDIADGSYEISAESNSPFFKIAQARLMVEGGKMSAEITVPSLSYRYVYPGTVREAEEAEESAWLGCREEDGKSVFTIPVEALDKEIDCAAYSKKRKMWYDRKLVFDASSLSEEALKIELPDYELIELALRAYRAKDGEGEGKEADTGGGTAHGEPDALPEAMDISRPDGEYSIEVNMTGGSGRASISSPTLLTVRDGKAYARLLWIIDGGVCYNLTEDGGNSVFEIPITVMDGPVPVIADTTAMGEPLEIAYTLTFYEESIGGKGQIPQEAAKKVLMIAAVIIAGGGLLNHYVKKSRR